MSEFKYEIIEDLGNIGEPTPTGWQKKLTFVSWNEGEPKYDIRSWSPDMSRMGKGLSLTKEELLDLNNILYHLLDEERDDECPMTKEEMLEELRNDA